MHAPASPAIGLRQSQNNFMSGIMNCSHCLRSKLWRSSKDNFHLMRLALTRQLF
jgi:hypothetical protein